MLQVDYAYYKDTYGGTLISEADFPSAIRQAYVYVNHITQGRAAKEQTDEVQAKINNACCAAAEYVHKSEQSGGAEVASETVGKWSRSFVSQGKTLQQRINASIRMYLSGTGLTYAGVGC